MNNKLKIVKFRKQDYLDDKSKKYVGFVKNQQQKTRQVKNNKPHVEYVDKDSKANLIVDKSNIPIPHKQNTKLADDYKLNFATLKKYNSDFDISDNQQFFQSSLKKNIGKVKVAMPKEYRPQQVIFNMKNSLFNKISKKQAEIKVQQIFDLPLMQQIMGRGDPNARQLKVTPLKDLNADQISPQKRYDKKERQQQENNSMAPMNQKNRFQSKQFTSPSKIYQISTGKKIQKDNKNNPKAHEYGYQNQNIEGSKLNNQNNYNRHQRYYDHQIIEQISSSQEYDQIQHNKNIYYNIDYKEPNKSNQIFNSLEPFNLPIYHGDPHQNQHIPQIKYNQNKNMKTGYINAQQSSNYYGNEENIDDLEFYQPNYAENQRKQKINKNYYEKQMMTIQDYQFYQQQENSLFYNQGNNLTYTNLNNVNNNMHPPKYVYTNTQNQRIPSKRNKSIYLPNNNHINLNHQNYPMNYFPTNQYEQNMIQESKYKYIQPLQQYFIDSSQSQQTQNYYQQPHYQQKINPNMSKNTNQNISKTINPNINKNVDKTQNDNRSSFIPKQNKSQFLFNNSIQEQYQYKN